MKQIKALRWKLIRWLLPKSSLEVSFTGRGFGLIQFTDKNQEPCSLQKSSSAFTEAIWLGRSELSVMKFHPNTENPWREVDFSDGQYVSNNRMHLTQLQVAMLLPILIKFVESGEIAP